MLAVIIALWVTARDHVTRAKDRQEARKRDALVEDSFRKSAQALYRTLGREAVSARRYNREEKSDADREVMLDELEDVAMKMGEEAKRYQQMSSITVTAYHYLNEFIIVCRLVIGMRAVVDHPDEVDAILETVVAQCEKQTEGVDESELPYYLYHL
ncbi:hypothetical protein MTR65_15965 [Novosphingobium sp. 2637]|uniref:DUF4760 domain-containing protein n=2 Tax=Novosphingobium mangrovi (ex Hu et al. 2023) TaxID=2930094 RepID=A0ABT0AG81_9SPHN|nr:hypothetical protein [Novosphingobium mangrovi (ex Hu et al. 2023)]